MFASRVHAGTVLRTAAARSSHPGCSTATGQRRVQAKVFSFLGGATATGGIYDIAVKVRGSL